MAVAEIVRQVESYKAKHVVVTGGEPMIMPEIRELCATLRERGKHITIETAATVFESVAVDLASMSPKLSNSTPHGSEFAAGHEKMRMNLPAIQRFIDESPDFPTEVCCQRRGRFGGDSRDSGETSRLGAERCTVDA